MEILDGIGNNMSGIAGAAELIINELREPSCIKCGRKYGDIGRHGKKLNCLKIMQAIPGIGVMTWCSRECRDEWISSDGEVLLRMTRALGDLG